MMCASLHLVQVRILEEELLNHAQISVHHGKTPVWNRGGLDILTTD